MPDDDDFVCAPLEYFPSDFLKTLELGAREGSNGWVGALYAIDHPDKPLVERPSLFECLTSDRVPDKLIRVYLADLVKRGVKPTPDPPHIQPHRLPQRDPWRIAINAVAAGNKNPLMELLLSEADFPPAARRALAALIARGIAKPEGHPATPAYIVSEKEALLLIASAQVRLLVRDRGWTVKEAVDFIAGQYALEPRKLAARYAGKRGATHRKTKALTNR